MKNTKLDDLNFLYLSARVSGLETRLLGNDGLTKLIDAHSFEDAVRMASEAFCADKSYGNYEELLSGELEWTYDEISEMLEKAECEKTLIDPLRYVYDCQNIKSLIKCEALGVSPDELLLSCGTVSAQQAKRAVSDREFSVFPFSMTSAAVAAIEELAQTGNPQRVDILLDKAAFEDMRNTAEQCGLDYLTELVDAKADLANIMLFARCTVQKCSYAFYKDVILPCGKLKEHFLLECFDGSTEKFAKELRVTQYGVLSELFYEKASLRTLEKACDDYYTELASSAKNVPFGAQKAISYIIAKENEIKNVRIILAGKKAGIPSDTLRERMRVCY